MAKRATFRDIAAHAGVSLGTVSRVFRRERVKPDTAARVRAAADELGYVASSANLRSLGLKTVVVLMSTEHDLRDSWTQQVAFSLLAAVGEYGYCPQIVLHDVGDDQTPLALHTACGCIVWGWFPEGFFAGLRGTCPDLPVVSYSSDISCAGSVRVFLDDTRAMQTLVEYLIACNHREIAYVSMTLSYKTNRKRLRSFQATLESFGLTASPDWIVEGVRVRFPETRNQTEVGLAAMESLLAMPSRPTAVVYASDIMAYGGLEAARRLGVSVPGGIAIAGFDDLPHSANTFPPLTTMGADLHGLGQAVMDVLEKLIFGRPHKTQIPVARVLMRRESVNVRR